MTEDPWEKLREMLPDSAAEALVRELESKSLDQATCRIALLIDLRNGQLRGTWRVSQVRGVNAHILT